MKSEICLSDTTMTDIYNAELTRRYRIRRAARTTAEIERASSVRPNSPTRKWVAGITASSPAARKTHPMALTKNQVDHLIDTYCDRKPETGDVDRLMRSGLTQDDADRINDPGGAVQDQIDSLIYPSAVV